MVVVGLDIGEGVKVAMPSFEVGGRGVPLTGVTVAVHNGALVISDPSLKLFSIGEPAWTLTWGMAEGGVDGEAAAVDEAPVAAE